MVFELLVCLFISFLVTYAVYAFSGAEMTPKFVFVLCSIAVFIMGATATHFNVFG